MFDFQFWEVDFARDIEGRPLKFCDLEDSL